MGPSASVPHQVTPLKGSIYAWNSLPSDGETSSDYPLTACCACSRVIVRDTPAAAWRHRDDGEAPITGPASGGWLGDVE